MTEVKWIRWIHDGRPSKLHLPEPSAPRTYTACGVYLLWRDVYERMPASADRCCKRCLAIQAREATKA